MNITEKLLYNSWEGLKKGLEEYINQRHPNAATVKKCTLFLPQTKTVYKNHRGTLIASFNNIIKDGDDLLVIGSIQFLPYMDNYNDCCIPSLNKVEIFSNKYGGAPPAKLPKHPMDVLTRYINDGLLAELRVELDIEVDDGSIRPSKLNLLKEIKLDEIPLSEAIESLKELGWKNNLGSDKK